MTKDNLPTPEIDMELPDISLKEITKIIATASAKASAIAVLPIPIIDIAGVTFVQVQMVDEIASRYGVNSIDKTKVIIGSIASNLLGKLVVAALDELAASTKVDKMLGESLIKATISGFVTTITGEVYADHFKNGGTFDDLSLSSALDYFRRQLNSDRISVDNVAQVAMSSITDKFNV